MSIDAHHHFWHPARGDYGWMPPNDPILSRPYSPADLSGELANSGINQTVLVHPKFAGVRPMIQDLADNNWMLRDDVQWAYQAIIDLDLTFDCLGFPLHLDNFLTLLKRYPTMRAVIDHCMKPQLRHHSDNNYQRWANGMTALAKDTNAFCKLSGVVTESDSDWSLAALQPYTDHVLNEFGAQRVMWGSDWPVVRLRCEYDDWYQLSQKLTSTLSPSERDRLFAGTAADFYKIQ